MTEPRDPAADTTAEEDAGVEAYVIKDLDPPVDDADEVRGGGCTMGSYVP